MPHDKPPRKPRSSSGPPFRKGPRKTGPTQLGSTKPVASAKPQLPEAGVELRLNQFIAHSGIAARRAADGLIREGLVTINGVVVTELGTRVVVGKDEVAVRGKAISPEAKHYILLNKPAGIIATTDDERHRRTVVDLINVSQAAPKARLYPVGRLDRATTGLILLTNDGPLTDRLLHPSREIQKVYHVTLDKPVGELDLKKLRTGLMLADGLAVCDEADYRENEPRTSLRLRLHSGRNRIVRRMFDYLGYEVESLDRVQFAFLTKKNLPRGEWRPLTKKEVNFLKMS